MRVTSAALKYDILLCYFAKYRYFSSPLTINGYVKILTDFASLEITALSIILACAHPIAELLIINLLRERSCSRINVITSPSLRGRNILVLQYFFRGEMEM